MQITIPSIIRAIANRPRPDWDDDDDDTTKKYKDEFTVKVPSDEGKHYLYVRAMDDDDNLCDYERFTYNVKENKYPGNADIVGDVNTKVNFA